MINFADPVIGNGILGLNLEPLPLVVFRLVEVLHVVVDLGDAGEGCGAGGIHAQDVGQRHR